MSTARPLSRDSDLTTSLAEARACYPAARPASAEQHRLAATILPGGNTRSVLAYGPSPTAMKRGAGCRLWDLDGHEYLDLCGEYTAGLSGHSEPRIHSVLREAMENGLSLAAVGQAEQRLATLPCARFPSMERVRFTNSGTEANLIAVMAARAFTERPALLAFRGGYHGGVHGFPLTGASPMAVPLPMVVAEYNDLEGSVAAIREHATTPSAVIAEPMLGSGGCIPARPEFLAALREETTAAGIPLILDEVMTSRMSAGGWQERLGLRPDLTPLRTYVAVGLSFGAFGGRQGIIDQFASALTHAGTFNNNVLSMAAGCVAMGEIFDATAADALFAPRGVANTFERAL